MFLFGRDIQNRACTVPRPYSDWLKKETNKQTRSDKFLSTFPISFNPFCTTTTISAWHCSITIPLLPSPCISVPSLYNVTGLSGSGSHGAVKNSGVSHLVLSLPLLMVLSFCPITSANQNRSRYWGQSVKVRETVPYLRRAIRLTFTACHVVEEKDNSGNTDQSSQPKCKQMTAKKCLYLNTKGTRG